MTYDTTVLADSPSAYWKLSDTSGTTAVDSSGNGRNATINGGVTLGAPGLVPGIADRSMSFDGVSGYVLAPVGLPALGTVYTVELWYAIDSFSNTGFNGLWGTDNPSASPFDGSDGGVHNSDGTNLWHNAGNGTSFTSLTTNAFPATQGVPLYYVATFNAGAMDLYVNAQLAANNTLSGTVAAGRFQFTIGARNQGGFGQFFGRIGHVAVYAGTALSLARIQAHYNAGLVQSLLRQGVANQ